METKQARMRENIKNAGSVAIYIGTASIMKPVVVRDGQNRNALTRLCSIFSGTVISCGVSHIASKWFGTMVDKIADFVEDVKATPKAKEADVHG